MQSWLIKYNICYHGSKIWENHPIPCSASHQRKVSFSLFQIAPYGYNIFPPPADTPLESHNSICCFLYPFCDFNTPARFVCAWMCVLCVYIYILCTLAAHRVVWLRAREMHLLLAANISADWYSNTHTHSLTHLRGPSGGNPASFQKRKLPPKALW
jgi:hypothetical protein